MAYMHRACLPRCRREREREREQSGIGTSKGLLVSHTPADRGFVCLFISSRHRASRTDIIPDQASCKQRTVIFSGWYSCTAERHITKAHRRVTHIHFETTSVAATIWSSRDAWATMISRKERANVRCSVLPANN